MIKHFYPLLDFGIEYPEFKFMLILGACAAMCVCNLIAIVFGKIISNKIPETIIQKSSGALFLIFGFIRIIKFYF